MNAAVAAMLVLCSWLPHQTWSWPHITLDIHGEPITVTHYRIYQSAFDPLCFDVDLMTQYASAEICNEQDLCQANPEPLVGDLVYFTISAVAVNLEGPICATNDPCDRRTEEECP